MGNGVRSPESAVPGRARDLLAMYSRASIRRWQGTCVQECGNHVNIVIVDDQTSARIMLRHILEDISPELDVLDFGDPQDALRWCEDNRPDLLLLDYRMPVIDGLEFARRFRRPLLHRDVPIVLVTVVGDEPIRQAALARSEGHTSELQSLMRRSYAVFGLKKKKTTIK